VLRPPDWTSVAAPAEEIEGFSSRLFRCARFIPSFARRLTMSTPKHPHPPEWKGDGVAPAPTGEAEAAASRAEGNGPVPPGSAAPEPPPGRTGKKHSTQQGYALGGEDPENVEEKRQAAVEDHEADRAAGTGTAPKKI
jgi:hypothetical protein